MKVLLLFGSWLACCSAQALHQGRSPAQAPTITALATPQDLVVDQPVVEIRRREDASDDPQRTSLVFTATTLVLATGTAPPKYPSKTAPPLTTDRPVTSESSSGGINIPLIAGVTSVAVFLLLLIVGFFFYIRHQRRKDFNDPEERKLIISAPGFNDMSVSGYQRGTYFGKLGVGSTVGSTPVPLSPTYSVEGRRSGYATPVPLSPSFPREGSMMNAMEARRYEGSVISIASRDSNLEGPAGAQAYDKTRGMVNGF